MSAWTPEPWQDANHGTHEIEAPPGRLIADFGDVDTAKADRDRAVACVNALADVANPKAELARLRQIEVAALALDGAAAALIQSFAGLDENDPTLIRAAHAMLRILTLVMERA